MITTSEKLAKFRRELLPVIVLCAICVFGAYMAALGVRDIVWPQVVEWLR